MTEFRVGVDIGGTFTDIVYIDEETTEIVVDKARSTPHDPAQGVLEAIEKIKADLSKIDVFSHGSTVGVNALVQGKGAKVGLITTRGFTDVLGMGRADRKELYNYLWKKPKPLVPRYLRFGVTERCNHLGEVTKELNEDEVLEIVCAEACRLTGATGSSVLLIEDEGWMKVGVSTGDLAPSIPRIPMNESLAGLAVQRGEPMLFNGPETQAQVYERNPDLHSLLVVPLRGKESFIGALDVINRPGGFSQESIRILELFAAQAAIAIENARLHHQAEELAVTKERQRLARELHDSVTQALYTASLYIDATNLALTSGKEDLAQDHLSELRNMVREAMLDMRLLIFELHPPALEQEGLVAALRVRLAAVEARAGLQTELEVEGERRLPITIEQELYRIAQEALNNVMKHAQAQHVTIRLQYGQKAGRPTVFLQVRDDGIGFDPLTALNAGGVGLRSFEERAAKLGGRVTVESSPGQGTTVTVEFETEEAL